MRIGSLCSGAGGLDMAVEQVFGAKTVWHCELDAAASKVLAHRWPGVPNHRDLTTADWDSVEPVDILAGGYPCQPFSTAGKRKGTADERHLWPYVAEAIRRIRPRLVVLENVAGHRSMGFDRVLGDLACIGFDADWCSVRASDVGAPHRRERLFVIAYPGSPGGRDSKRDGHEEQSELSPPQRRDLGRRARAADVDLLPTPAAARSGRNQSPSPGAAIRPSLDMIGALLPTPAAADAGGTRAARGGDRSGELLLNGIARAHTGQWGQYEAAIRRWEHHTRPAPSPTELSRNDKPRLNPAFSEWMMGWPAGWVTDVPGISRNDQLRIIGNGVVPQCAAAALTWLLSIEQAA